MKLLIDFILVAGIIINSLIVYTLIKDRKKDFSKRILIVFFLFIFSVSIHAYAGLHHLKILHTISFLFDFTIIWFLGPLLLLYIRALFSNEKNIFKKNVQHFILPFVVTIFIGIPVLITLLDIPLKYISFLEEHQTLIISFRNIFFTYYILKSLTEFKKYRNVITHTFSHISKLDIEWVFLLFYGSFFIIVFDLFAIWHEVFFGSFILNSGYITMIAIILLISYLGYHGVHQSTILLPQLVSEGPLLETFKKNRNYTTLHWNPDEIKMVEQELLRVLKTEKIYLNQELTLRDLSDKIKTTDKKLSFLLNQCMKTTFYDYINSYRIEEVKNKLATAYNTKYTILAIAYDAGFKSKATFNRVFKKATGISPSQYRKKNSSSLSH